MMTAGAGDFSYKTFGAALVRNARFPLDGSRRGRVVVRVGVSEQIGGALRVHCHERALFERSTPEIGGIDQARPVGLQFGNEAVSNIIRIIRVSVRTWLRGVKSWKIVRKRIARNVYVASRV